MSERLNIHELASGAINNFIAIEKYLVKSGLDRTLQHLIQIRASQINGCIRCLKIHTTAALAAGESNERIFLLNAWKHSSAFTEREKAVLALTESVTRVSENGVPDEIYEPLKKYFSDQEIADIVVAICIINTWNRINVTAGNE